MKLEVEELKSFMAEEIASKVSEEITELKSDLSAAKAESENLRAEVEELKTNADKTHNAIQVSPPIPEVKWAEYYRNMFTAVHPHQQVEVKGLDGGSKNIILTPQKRVEALEKLQQIAGVDEIQKAAWAEGTSSLGGYVVPTPQDLIGQIIRLAAPASIALQDCLQYPMRSLTLPLTGAGATGASVAWVDEAAAIAESEPNLRRVTLTAKKMAAYSKVSNELLADADADVVGYLNQLFAEAMGQELDEQLFNGNTGTSTNVFTGIFVKASVNNVTMGTGTATDAFTDLTGDHLSSMISKLNSVALSGAKFYMHRTVAHSVRTLKDSNGNYLYHPYTTIGGDAPTQNTYAHEGEIWGVPMRSAEKCPSTSAASTAFIALGNLKRIWLGRRADMSMALDPYGLFLNDQVRLRVTSRWAIAVPLPSALVKLTTGATS